MKHDAWNTSWKMLFHGKVFHDTTPSIDGGVFGIRWAHKIKLNNHIKH